MIKNIALTFVVMTVILGPVPARAQLANPLDDQLRINLQSGPCKNMERLQAVKDLFVAEGASASDIRIDKFKDLQNVVLSKKGKTDEWIIVGAHYDKVDEGCGIIDNWSGIVILAHLYAAITKQETQKSYLFVAFDSEETGLKGSAAMVKAISNDDRPKYCSMVNLDSFGLGYPVILEKAASTKMLGLAKDLGTELKVPVTPISESGADADSSSFKQKGIPAITISALSPKWEEYLHTPKDKIENVNVSSVRVGFLYSKEYLARVDAAACSSYR